MVRTGMERILGGHRMTDITSDRSHATDGMRPRLRDLERYPGRNP